MSFPGHLIPYMGVFGNRQGFFVNLTREPFYLVCEQHLDHLARVLVDELVSLPGALDWEALRDPSFRLDPGQTLEHRLQAACFCPPAAQPRTDGADLAADDAQPGLLPV